MIAAKGSPGIAGIHIEGPHILAGAAILSDAYAGLIPDGIHVDWAMLRLALAARPRPDRCFLVSDAMPTVGGPDAFTLYGQRIKVRDGRLVNPQGPLAVPPGMPADSLAVLDEGLGFAGWPDRLT